MSYETDVMDGLRYALKNEVPKISRDLNNFNKNFNGAEVVNRLEKNTNEQQISNILKLCELSQQHPEYELLTNEEVKELLKGVRDNIINSRKEETKKKSFFR
ncbi:MAG: hypothetical protein PHW32_01445 [Bacilli bacterium]|nr:hypothetical protein [Bacilli bacterium]MDD4719201.1 hypothetical protein [Bacilli bacterium]